MGGSSSQTRKFVVENEDPTSVIKVSEEVVDRIKGSLVTPMVRQEPATIPQGVLVQQPIYVTDPRLTSLQIRQATVEELEKNDAYWKGRLKKLKERQQQMEDIMKEEERKTYEEFRERKVTARLTEPPCLDNKKAVTECYQCNPDEPMKCAKLVQAFQECVDLKSRYLLENRG